MSERDLHRDPWMMERIGRALDAVRHAEYAGLETELDLIAFAEDVLEHYGAPEKGKAVDVRFTFEEGEPEPDGYRDLRLVGIERTRCDLTDEQASGVGEDWSQSDRYSIGYSMDLIGVVADGDRAEYPEGRVRL